MSSSPANAHRTPMIGERLCAACCTTVTAATIPFPQPSQYNKAPHRAGEISSSQRELSAC